MTATEAKIALRPARDYVVVSVLTEEVSQGGIVIPQNVRESDKNQAVYVRGRVVSVGPGKPISQVDPTTGELVWGREPMSVKDGDQIISYPGRQIEYCGEKFTVVHEEQIVGTVEEV